MPVWEAVFYQNGSDAYAAEVLCHLKAVILDADLAVATTRNDNYCLTCSYCGVSLVDVEVGLCGIFEFALLIYALIGSDAV